MFKCYILLQIRYNPIFIWQDFDKQMGDLGEEEETEKLDERMWGSDDEDEEDDKSDEKKEEKGKGMDAVSGTNTFLKFCFITFLGIFLCVQIRLEKAVSSFLQKKLSL